MSRFVISPAARTDLRDIYRYIATDNSGAAASHQQMLIDRFKSLAAHPLIGRARDDLVSGLRIFPARKYVICYERTRDGIRILCVIHSARDLDALF